MTFFVLGTHPELSLAEIEAVTSSNPTQVGDTIALTVDFDAEALQESLAGAIKIGRIIGKLQHGLEKHEIAEKLAVSVPETDGKLHLGISIYQGEDKQESNRLIKRREQIGLELKKLLKAEGRSVRYVSSKEPELSSVIVRTNKLIKTGIEFVLIPTKDALLVGITETAQDFSAWSDRDFGRPARDAKSGMLPPKLARMLVNIAVGTKDIHELTLLDPFCGSGTVLMEASLLGIANLIGSDISEKAIQDTHENLEWMQKGDIPLVVSDARDLEQHISSPVDVIVGETFLGPPLKGNESIDQLRQNGDALMAMYEVSFKTLYRILKNKGSMIIAFPAFRHRNDLIRLPLQKMLESLDFKIEKTFLYEREGQKVAREIIQMKK